MRPFYVVVQWSECMQPRNGSPFSMRRVSDHHLPPLKAVFKQLGSVNVKGSSSQGHNFKGLSVASPLSVMFLVLIFCRCKSRCKLSCPLPIFCGVMDLSGTSLAFTLRELEGQYVCGSPQSNQETEEKKKRVI